MAPHLRSPESAGHWGAADPHKAAHCSRGSRDSSDLWDLADRTLGALGGGRRHCPQLVVALMSRNKKPLSGPSPEGLQASRNGGGLHPGHRPGNVLGLALG